MVAISEMMMIAEIRADRYEKLVIRFWTTKEAVGEQKAAATC